MQYWYCQFVAIVQDYADIKTVYDYNSDILIWLTQTLLGYSAKHIFNSDINVQWYHVLC